MVMNRIHIIAAVTFTVMSIAAATTLTAARFTRQAPSSGTAIILQRLESLSPDEPKAYFELAEDIEDLAQSETDKALARTLYGLAGALAPRLYGRSACVALASLTDVSDELSRRKFQKLAAMLDVHSLQPMDDTLTGASPEAAYALALALSEFRTGRGKHAINAIESTPGAKDLLLKHEHIVRGGARRFLEDCKIYSTGPKPPISDEMKSQMLRIEAALLAPTLDDRSWSGDLLLTRHSPLVEVDPQRLDDAFDVDLNRPYYRAGRWVESP